MRLISININEGLICGEKTSPESINQKWLTDSQLLTT